MIRILFLLLQPEDNAARVEEAIARMIFCKWMTFTKNTDHWLNPNEVSFSLIFIFRFCTFLFYYF